MHKLNKVVNFTKRGAKMLSERKKKILQAVVNENIKKAEPISSKELQERFFQGVSSATIRNDLSGLEEMGYLFSPHTSSGRVPTMAGFKKYIEELMPEKELTREEVNALKQNFNRKISGIEELAQVVAETIAQATNYASIVELGLVQDAVIENVKLVLLTPTDILVVLVTDLGVIKDLTIELDQEMTEEDALIASRILTQSLTGLTIAEISVGIGIDFIQKGADKYRKLFEVVIDVIQNRKEKPIKRVNGTLNLLSEPEYNSAGKAKEAIKIFENAELLAPIVDAGSDLEVSIKVGATEDSNCSVVSLNYKLNGKNIGRAGLVGPLRMDYAKAVSVLKQVSQVVTKEVKGLLPKPTSNNKRRRFNGRKRARNGTNHQATKKDN